MKQKNVLDTQIFFKSLIWGPLKSLKPNCNVCEQPWEHMQHETRAKCYLSSFYPIEPRAFRGSRSPYQIIALATTGPNTSSSEELRGRAGVVQGLQISAAPPHRLSCPPRPSVHPQGSLRPSRLRGWGRVWYLQQAETPPPGKRRSKLCTLLPSSRALRGRLCPSSPIFITSVPI